MNEVHVWSFALDQSEWVARYGGLLSDDENERAARFHFERDARRYTAGRATLRIILSQYLGVQPAALAFGYNAYGKPHVCTTQKDIALEFNLSHSGDSALCAVTLGRAVGIDLEQWRELDYLELAQSVFSAAEVAALQAVADDQRAAAFYNGWTRKEAYIKAHGRGLSMPLADFDVTLAPSDPARLLATRPNTQEAARWTLYDLPVAECHTAALVVAGSGDQIRRFDARDLR